MQRLKVLGLSLLALCALGAVLSASAWATGAPENTVPPTVTNTAPKVGTYDTVLNGSWTNSPTKYAYQWQRCNSSGKECLNIAGGTAKSYLVAEADGGHTLVARVTASNASGEGVAFSAPTSVVPITVHPEIVPAPTETEQLRFESSLGELAFERANQSEYLCNVVVTGSFINATEAKRVRMSFSSCTQGFGPWTTEYLTGKLGYISAASHTVALELSPEVGSLFIKSWLNGAPLEGSAFGQITPVNHKTKKLELNYTSAQGIQGIQGFEGKTGTHLTWSSSKESVALLSPSTSPLALSTAREVEIKG